MDKNVEPRMKATRVDLSNSKAVAAYIDLPLHLHDDPKRMPILRTATAFDLSAQHPFYEHSEAAFFITGPLQAPTGRIAVLNNRNYNAYHGSHDAFFTHFECREDSTVAAALFSAAEQWAKERGLTRLLGPVGFLQTDARGLMTAGYERLTSFALPYSPPFYATLLQGYGFEKHIDYLSCEISNDFKLSERIESMARHVEQRSGLHVCNAGNRRKITRLAPRLLDIYTQAGTNVPLYYPITESEKKWILRQMLQLGHPHLIHWLEKDDTLYGMHLALPNYAAALRRAGTNRLARTIALLRQRRYPKEVNFSMVYITPAVQGRGFNLLLHLACQQSALKLGYQRALLGPMLEINAASRSMAQKNNLVFDIIHRVFKKEVV